MERRFSDQQSDEDDILPSLQTVTVFDDGSDETVHPAGGNHAFDSEEISDPSQVIVTNSMVKPDVTQLAGDGERTIALEEKVSSQTSFLIGSLVKQLCRFMEKDAVKERALYNVICRILYKMKLIDGTYAIEEFEFMRHRYLQAMLNLLQIASLTNETESSKELIMINRTDENNKVLPRKFPQPASRYQVEFVELEYIAHGGFGHVYKARNKLDGGEYAVKKICLRYRNVDSFLKRLQEVKLLAQLHHPNIVSYKAAWLEPFHSASKANCESSITDDSLSPPVYNVSHRIPGTNSISSSQRERSVEFKSVTSDSSSHSNVGKINSEKINYLPVSDIQLENEGKKLLQESHDTLHHLFSMSTNTESSEEKAVCVFSQSEQKKSKKFEYLLPPEGDCATLYIQMQLCDQTLQQWLNERNSKKTPVNTTQCIGAFHHLVCGVEYIHSKGIVHHDIKPSNIFVNSDLTQVQVGDFGLACFLQHKHNDVTLLPQSSVCGDHQNMEIGTKMYAAPEQLMGVCDQKSDIYSLGIVLFELLQPCYTDMEKSILITQLKDGIVPKGLCAVAPKLVEMMIRLTSCSVDKRPTSKELLTDLDNLAYHNMNENCSAHETIQRLLSVISERDKEIEELKRENSRSAQEITTLKLKLERYEALSPTSDSQ